MTIDLAPVLSPVFPLPRDAPFTVADARAAGVSKRRLTEWCRSGVLRRVLRGIYVSGLAEDSLELRCACLRLVVPPGCFVSDRTAAWLHGASMALAPNEHLDVPLVSCFRPSDAGRLRNPIAASGERWVRKGDLMELHGLLVTTPLRTAYDLGRLQRRDLAMAGMDALLRLGEFGHEELLAGVEWFRRQRGVCQLRVLAPLADGGAASAGESALRLRWYDAGLPRPRTQIPVLEDGRERYLLDLGLEDLLYAVEYDGKEWHADPERREHDRERRQWCSDHHGWLIDPFEAEDVYGQHQNADETIRASLRVAVATLAGRRRTFL